MLFKNKRLTNTGIRKKINGTHENFMRDISNVIIFEIFYHSEFFICFPNRKTSLYYMLNYSLYFLNSKKSIINK